MKYDELIETIGEFGPYQKRIFILTCLPAFSTAIQTMISIFILAVPNYRCAIPGLDNDTYNIDTDVHWALLNHTIWWADADPNDVNNVWGSGQCHILENRSALDVDATLGNVPVSNTTVSCDKWTYDESVFSETFVSQAMTFTLKPRVYATPLYQIFPGPNTSTVKSAAYTRIYANDWVCERKDLRSHSNMLYMTGVMIGSLLSGIISDRLGRKIALLLSTLLHVVPCISVAFAPNFISFAILRFLTGIGDIGVYLTAFVLAVEMVGPKRRAQMGVSFTYFWCLGLFFLCGVAYAFRNWKTLQLVTAGTSTSLLLIWWFIPESPRWLISKGRYKEAEVILEKIALSNNKTLPKYFIDSENGNKTEGKLIDVFKHSILAFRAIIVFINWFVVTVMFYGLSFNVTSLDGNIYQNFFLSSVVETLGYTMCLLAIPRIGRKKFHLLAMLLSGLACLSLIIPGFLKVRESWISVLLSSVGKLGASGGFSTMFVLAAELFPTQLRNSMVGTSSMMARVGGMISPYIADLGILVGGTTGKVLPFIVFGSCGIIAALLTLLLPETLNQKLPETIEEAVTFGRSNKVYAVKSSSENNSAANCSNKGKKDFNPQSYIEKKMLIKKNENSSFEKNHDNKEKHNNLKSLMAETGIFNEML